MGDHVSRAGSAAPRRRPDEARQRLGHLDAREALLARLGVAHDHAEAERQTGDVRERLAGPDRERRQHRVDLAVAKPISSSRRSSAVGVVDRRRRGSPRPRAPGASSLAPELRLGRGQLEHARRAPRPAPAAACGRPGSAPGRPRRTWSSSPATRTMKNSSRLDEKIAQNLTRSSRGSSGSAASSRTRAFRSSHESSRLRSGLVRSLGRAVAGSSPRLLDHPGELVNDGFRFGEWYGRLPESYRPSRDGSRSCPRVAPLCSARCGTTACSSPSPRSSAIALIAIAVVYFAEPAKSLPSFFPGHQAGSSHHHVKHGIAAFLRRPRLLRLRLVPHRAEAPAPRPRDPRRADLLPAGRSSSGSCRASPSSSRSRASATR